MRPINFYFLHVPNVILIMRRKILYFRERKGSAQFSINVEISINDGQNCGRRASWENRGDSVACRLIKFTVPQIPAPGRR